MQIPANAIWVPSQLHEIKRFGSGHSSSARRIRVSQLNGVTTFGKIRCACKWKYLISESEENRKQKWEDVKWKWKWKMNGKQKWENMKWKWKWKRRAKQDKKENIPMGLTKQKFHILYSKEVLRTSLNQYRSSLFESNKAITILCLSNVLFDYRLFWY